MDGSEQQSEKGWPRLVVTAARARNQKYSRQLSAVEATNKEVIGALPPLLTPSYKRKSTRQLEAGVGGGQILAKTKP